MTKSEKGNNDDCGGDSVINLQSWADSDRDTASDKFVAHIEVARLISEILPADSKVIEFGCAEGNLGEQLALYQFEQITGLEHSQTLRASAVAKNCYRSVRAHDLTQPLRDDVRYNAGVCVGVFGNGPANEAHISYMTSALVEDAPLFITVNGQGWLNDDWPTRLEAAQQADGFTIEYINTIAYLDKEKPDGRLIILKNSDSRNEM